MLSTMRRSSPPPAHWATTHRPWPRCAELAQARDRSGLFDMAGFARDLSALLQRLAGEQGWQGVDIA